MIIAAGHSGGEGGGTGADYVLLEGPGAPGPGEIRAGRAGATRIGAPLSGAGKGESISNLHSKSDHLNRGVHIGIRMPGRTKSQAAVLRLDRGVQIGIPSPEGKVLR